MKKSLACGFLMFSVCATACSADAGSNSDAFEGSASDDSAILRPTATGGRDQVVMLYITVQNSSGLATRTCSGTYFAPRVVLTAAHCLENVYRDQVFVYYGDNFTQDFSQLTQQGALLVPPAPGAASFWSKADSFEKHPKWDPKLVHPDMGVVYLDRKLPFDPLPIGRFRLDSTWVNKSVTIVGWGGNAAPTPTTTSGSRVERTGTTKVLGSPTASDYHPEDPNAGMLDATVRQNVVKTDGRAPNSNTCFGDSGGPLIANSDGQDYVAGVSYWTGLSCADYGLFTRIDPFLPFVDAAYKKGGQSPLVPTFDCVAPKAGGGYTAYFGYTNQNGINLSIPYGTKNQLALDKSGFRPTLFTPGEHHFTTAVDFTASQTVTYTLSPDGSPSTMLTVTSTSKACGASNAASVECGAFCEASLRSGCTGLPNFSTCMTDCLANTQFVSDTMPQCLSQNTAVNQCTAKVGPGTKNWTCLGAGIYPQPNACTTQLNALSTCFGP